MIENKNLKMKMLASCGLFCEVCPMIKKNKCSGCNANKGYAKFERKLCGIIKCCRKQNIERCNECEIFPDCERLTLFTKWDSFISHAPVIDNLKSLNQNGEIRFIELIEEKIKRNEYPPKPKSGGITIKNIWKLMKPPFKPIKP